MADTSTASEASNDTSQLRQAAMKVLSSAPDCPLRGTSILEVLHWGGEMLQQDSRGRDWFRTSTVVARVVFLSHNWTMRRSRKYLCLLVYSESATALVTCVLMLVVVTFCTCLGHLPIIDTPWGPSGISGLLAWPVFSLTLFLGPELKRLLGVRGHSCFFDRACIPQNDDELKRRHIQSLGAYVNQSTRFVACYSGTYLRKLWTTYEVACFLMLSNFKHVTVIPEGLPSVLLSFTALISAFSLSRFLSEVPSAIIDGVIVFVFVVAGSVMGRIWARMQRRMWEAVENFSIHAAECSRPEDRPLVEANIVTLLKAQRGLPKDIDDAEALQAFDKFVQREVPLALISSWGHAGLPYGVMAGAVIVANIPLSLDIWAGHVAAGMDTCEALALLPHSVLFRFTGGPMVVAFHLMLTRKCLHLQHFKEWLFLTIISLALYSITVLLFFASRKLSDRACESKALMFVLCVYHAALGVTTILIFRPRSPHTMHA